LLQRRNLRASEIPDIVEDNAAVGILEHLHQPPAVDDAIFEVESGWAADIRRMRNIGDMRAWKDHDAYQKAFERLLRDLRSEGAARGPVR
jgi:hypothetical protein